MSNEKREIITDKECTCGNPEWGFDCACEWIANHPGDIQYGCEWCGIYQASAPKCSKCESEVA